MQLEVAACQGDESTADRAQSLLRASVHLASRSHDAGAVLGDAPEPPGVLEYGRFPDFGECRHVKACRAGGLCEQAVWGGLR